MIRGTPRRDVIVARAGNDRIYGRGGNDVICGGRGHDRIYGKAGRDLALGGPGKDVLLGGAGSDRLFGGANNDRFDGGSGFDRCVQDAGAGIRVRCERPVYRADLSVVVDGGLIDDDTRDYDVIVTNNGPTATGYVISHTAGPNLASECTPLHVPSGTKAPLAAGASRKHVYEYECLAYYLEASLSVSVEPTPGTIDPISGNDTSEDSTIELF